MQDSLLASRPAWLPAALAALGRHQFLTARQIAALVAAPPAEVKAVLAALVAEKLLVPLEPTRMLDSANVESAFALTRRGAMLLARSSGARALRVPSPRKSLYMLAHELARNELGVVLEILDRDGKLRLLRWETARTRIGDSVTIVVGGHPLRVPLVADALAVFEISGKPDALLVEIDMGTVSIPRMRTKYAGYLAWWREGGPERRFGLRSLRVLTIVPNENRLSRLREAAVQANDGKASGMFWFGEQKQVDVGHPERLVGPDWTTTAGNDVPAALWSNDQRAPGHRSNLVG
jgi:hypothetical protein